MITESTFNIMVAVAALLLIYSIVDNKNNLYANITATVISGITFLYLGQAITIGAVVFTSRSLGDLLSLFGYIAFGYAIFMAADAIFESINSEENKMPQGNEDANQGDWGGPGS